MRWIEPRPGDEKIVKKFALFPITICEETRWLEWVTIKYVYRSYAHTDMYGDRYLAYRWSKETFIDEDKNT